MTGEERFWSLADRFLLLMDEKRVVLWIFDTSSITTGRMIGCPRQSDYRAADVWLVRPEAFATLQPGSRRPVLVGPLQAQANTHAAFLASWRGNEDFSVVLAPAGSYEGIRPRPFSRNLGGSPHAEKFESSVNHTAPAGFQCMPAFFHVLHDCLLVDGSVVITRDGAAVNETTQFQGFGSWDTDFWLTGSGTDPTKPDIFVADGSGLALDFPMLLFSSLKNGYGHWLGQSVTNAHFLDWIRDASPELADSLVLSILSGLTNEDFRAVGLRLLDLTNPVVVPPKGIVRCKKLIVPSFHRSHSHHWPGIGGTFQKMAARARLLAAGAPHHERIYSSRSGQSRSFTNDPAINAVLTKHDFKPLVGGSMPYVEQVALYNSAQFVFGIFGSNMCNISFCRPGSMVIEILDEFLADPYWDYFLANAAGLDFAYIITKVPEAQRALGYYERTVDLDPELLDEVLQVALSG